MVDPINLDNYRNKSKCKTNSFITFNYALHFKAN